VTTSQCRCRHVPLLHRALIALCIEQRKDSTNKRNTSAGRKFWHFRHAERLCSSGLCLDTLLVTTSCLSLRKHCESAVLVCASECPKGRGLVPWKGSRLQPLVRLTGVVLRIVWSIWSTGGMMLTGETENH